MRILAGQIRLAATDLSNHSACRHVTTLDLEVVRGLREEPEWAAPDLRVIQELGLRHEKKYLEYLGGLDAAEGGRKLDVVKLGDIKDEKRLIEETLALMEHGVDVIAQGALGDGEWFGRPDVLRRVEKPGKWPWSYEVVDTKLTRETKATTILQLSLYSELLQKVQGVAPEFLWVVTPATGGGFSEEQYRVAEYAAYYRHVKKGLVEAVGRGVATVKDVASGEWRVASKEKAAFAAGSGAQFALDFGKQKA
jgi:predicted RecB family nuclease